MAAAKKKGMLDWPCNDYIGQTVKVILYLFTFAPFHAGSRTSRGRWIRLDGMRLLNELDSPLTRVQIWMLQEWFRFPY